jgi:hypothetical protein
MIAGMSGTIDAWMQHPTLRRWMSVSRFEEALPLDLTIAAMDAGGVEIGR